MREKVPPAAAVTPDLVAALREAATEMASSLRELVELESPSSDAGLLARCAEGVDRLGERLLGTRATRVAVGDRVHLRWDLGRADGGPGVLLLGHYDTVWPEGTLARRPFHVDAEGRASGPGVFDMKGGIVQMLHAVAAARSSRPDLAVTVLLTADEEVGSPTSRRLVEAAAAGALAALVLEPAAGRQLKIARKGTSMYEVRVSGRSAHAGLEPEKGVNATVELASQVLEVAALGRPELGTTVTPTVASAGTTTNTVPADAVLHVDVRATSRAEQERVDASIRALRPRLAGAGVEVVGGVNRPPFHRSASEGLVARAAAVAEMLGLPCPGGVEVGGASDGNFTAGVGVATLDGLGAAGDGAHAEGEHVLLAEMPVRAALVAGLLLDLCP